MDHRWLNRQSQHQHQYPSAPAGRYNNPVPSEAPRHGGAEVPVEVSRHSDQVEPSNHGGVLIPASVARQNHQEVQSAPLSRPAGYGAPVVHAAAAAQPSLVQASPQPVGWPYNVPVAPQSQQYQQSYQQPQPRQEQAYQPQYYHQQPQYQTPVHQQQANPQHYPDYRQPSAGYYNPQAVRHFPARVVQPDLIFQQHQAHAQHQHPTAVPQPPQPRQTHAVSRFL